MKKFTKILVALSMSVTLTIPVLSGEGSAFAYSSGTEIYDETPLEESLDNIMNVIEENIVINNTGLALHNKEQVIRDIEQKDVDNLKKLAKNQGVEYDQPLNKKYIVEMFEEGIQEMDQAVKSDELTVLSNGSMIDSNDDDFYVQGGSTYDVSYWWGKERYKSTKAANVWVRDLYSVGHINAGSAAIAGAIFGGVGAIPNGLSALYAYNLADRVSYRNNLNNRGIIANLTYALVFTTKSQ